MLLQHFPLYEQREALMQVIQRLGCIKYPLVQPVPFQYHRHAVMHVCNRTVRISSEDHISFNLRGNQKMDYACAQLGTDLR